MYCQVHLLQILSENLRKGVICHSVSGVGVQLYQATFYLWILCYIIYIYTYVQIGNGVLSPGCSAKERHQAPTSNFYHVPDTRQPDRLIKLGNKDGPLSQMLPGARS
jgi:hypothetical protein